MASYKSIRRFTLAPSALDLQEVTIRVLNDLPASLHSVISHIPSIFLLLLSRCPNKILVKIVTHWNHKYIEVMSDDESLEIFNLMKF